MDFEQIEEFSLIIFGRTGVGKSTLVNAMALCGANRANEIIKLTEEDNDGVLVEIGHTLISKTSIPKDVKFKFEGYEVKFTDTPGFCDNRMGMTAVKVMQEILTNLKKMSENGGFHLGLYCINACNQRVDSKDLEDLKTLCLLLGSESSKHIKIVLTQSNRLSSKERIRAKTNFTQDLGSIFEENGIDISTDDLIWAEFDNFEEAFSSKMKKIFDSSPKRCKPAINVDPNNEEDMAKALSSPEIQEILKRKEEEAQRQTQELQSLIEAGNKMKIENEKQRAMFLEAQRNLELVRANLTAYGIARKHKRCSIF